MITLYIIVALYFYNYLLITGIKGLKITRTQNFALVWRRLHKCELIDRAIGDLRLANTICVVNLQTTNGRGPRLKLTLSPT